MQDVHALPKNVQGEIISRIKILAGLRTDEHQTAQDGRFRNIVEHKTQIDVRVSLAPTYYGENAVLRILADKADEFTLKTLGLSADNQEKILAALKRPYGMILTTGPTGSGKTTTLYTLLKILNTREVSIITLEDPIEYAIPGLNQIQINSRANLSFANGLRSILRQDPNIIMVGEIRDSETARLAVNTSLTGHLLLSTLHTNDAATTLPRLLDLGIEPYLIASTVNLAIGQRLVRKICDNCKVKQKIKPPELEALRSVLSNSDLAALGNFWIGRGCAVCDNQGYKGRLGIYEVLVADSVIKEAVLKKCTASELKNLAIKQGMQSMAKDGLRKIAQGLTTITEVVRILYD